MKSSIKLKKTIGLQIYLSNLKVEYEKYYPPNLYLQNGVLFFKAIYFHQNKLLRTYNKVKVCWIDIALRDNYFSNWFLRFFHSNPIIFASNQTELLFEKENWKTSNHQCKSIGKGQSGQIIHLICQDDVEMRVQGKRKIDRTETFGKNFWLIQDSYLLPTKRCNLLLWGPCMPTVEIRMGSSL